MIRQRQTHTFARLRGQRQVTVATATFEGVLRIDDPATFRTVLTNGIGHAKAYGCGLMTLAAPQSAPAGP
jgi:CRISPR system Cascade subunit CasE